MTAGDIPRFTGGIHNPADKLNDLARRVGMLEAVRYAPPLEYRTGPAGALVSLAGIDDILCRLNIQADPPELVPPFSPRPNKWSWLEVVAKSDGTVIDKPNGRSGGGDLLFIDGYAVPIAPAYAVPNAVGIVKRAGDTWEWLPIAPGGIGNSAPFTGPATLLPNVGSNYLALGNLDVSFTEQFKIDPDVRSRLKIRWAGRYAVTATAVILGGVALASGTKFIISVVLNRDHPTLLGPFTVAQSMDLAVAHSPAVDASSDLRLSITSVFGTLDDSWCEFNVFFDGGLSVQTVNPTFSFQHVQIARLG